MDKSLRQIRSFVLRQKGMTESKAALFNRLFEIYGVNYNENTIDLAKLFASDRPKILEIGFGMGDSFIEAAKQNHNCDFLGVDVYAPGVLRVLTTLEREGIDNVRLARCDATCVLTNMLADASLHGVCIFFPDPWPKKRHHKHRLLNNSFVNLLATKIKGSGFVHFATDWADYAREVVEIFQNNKMFRRPCDTKDNFVMCRYDSKFATRGKLLGHEIFDEVFIRK